MPRNVKFLVGVIAAAIVVAAVIVFVMHRQPANNTPAAERVRIEVRSFPAMTIKKDGKKLGQTPVSFIVAKGDKPISLDADWTEQRIYAKGQQLVPRHAHKDVVPNKDQTVDFATKDADPVKVDPIE